MNYSPWMTQYIVEKGLLEKDPVCLIDVGASGGIASYWGLFGKYFKAFGFEPLISECERLNADKNKPENIAYFPYLVGTDDGEVSAEAGAAYASKVFIRTSAARGQELQKNGYVQEYFNSGKEVVYADEKISIDRFFDTNPVESVDFMKIDTDGYDYEVLHGAQKTLIDKQILGITVEAQFHGKSHCHSNTFRNIDRMLTDMGFTLFDLEVYKYTRKDLPGTFACTIPAQTTTGQALWGEALYFRDFTAEDSTKEMSAIKLLKLACLLELFELPDCSAELLNVHKEKLSSLVDVQRCLDLLVKATGKQCTYHEYIKKFEDNFEDFYPSKKIQFKKDFFRFLKLNMDSKKYFISRLIKKVFNS